MTEPADNQGRLQKAQKRYAEGLKEQGMTRTTLLIEDDFLEKLRKLAKTHGITQNHLISVLLTGQIKALSELEEVFETMRPEAAELARYKTRRLAASGAGTTLTAVDMISSQMVEEMAAELPPDEAAALHKKYQFVDTQEGAA